MTSETTEALVRAATLAPSSHNTQPWRFRANGDTVELFADRTRALPVNDPYDRELTLSCGAALFNLRVAAAALGRATRIELLPSEDPDLLARVSLVEGEPEELAELEPALTARHTTRDAFSEQPIAEHLTERLLSAARREGPTPRILGTAARNALAVLVGEGDRRQFDDPRWRRELASWLRPRRKGDGLATSALAAPVARAVVRALDLGERTARGDAQLAASAPLLLVLSSDGDEPRDWLAVGQALERVLLEAAADGVQAGYLNQPCQVEPLRDQLAKLVGDHHPQVVLRLGHPAKALDAAPRRPVDAVLERP